MEIYLPLIFLLISLVIGFALHEAGHAYAANHLGDPTAKNLGRLTLNPLPHLDPFGTVLLPVLLIAAQWPIVQQGGLPLIFAAAKPVPVNPRNFKRPFADFAFVAAAGPMVNIALAFLGALIHNFTPAGLPHAFIESFVFINLILAFFNLLPIPPLDGSKIIAGFLPRLLAQQILQLDRIGFLLIIGLIILGNLIGFSIIGAWIGFWMGIVAQPLEIIGNLLSPHGVDTTL